MEQEELKRKLAGLWEKTTHHSKELINTFFNNYFDSDYIEYKEVEGKIVSALFGIPYKFGYGNKFLNALYIISLSSEEGFHKKGILSELLNDFNNRHSIDFDFTFLVPGTELMADYYSTQGYFNSSFILEERFTPYHNFKNDYFLSLTDSDERIKGLKMALFDEITVSEFNGEDNIITQEQIINFIKGIEEKGSSFISLWQSPKNLKYLLQNDSIRNLNSFVALDSDGKISGIAITHKEEIKRIRVLITYVEDICSYYAILDFIKKQYPDVSISVNTVESKYQVHSIIQQTYAASNPNGGDLDNTFDAIDIPFNLNRLLQPLGMVKILRFENILKYLAERRSDLDFKLFIRDYNPGNSEEMESKVYIIRNSKFKTELWDKYKKDNTVLNLSIKEISELLLRKNDSSSLIMEAFGIPPLNLQFRLLPQ